MFLYWLGSYMIITSREQIIKYALKGIMNKDMRLWSALHLPTYGTSHRK